MVKNLPAYIADVGSIPGLRRPPGEGNDNTPQYSCLENPMDRGAWQATVHGVIKSWIRLSSCSVVLVNTSFQPIFTFNDFNSWKVFTGSLRKHGFNILIYIALSLF